MQALYILHNLRMFARGVLVQHRRGIPPVLVGFLSPSLVGALWRVITGEDGACMPVPRVACADPIRRERSGVCHREVAQLG